MEVIKRETEGAWLGGGEFLNLHGKKFHRVKYTDMST